MDRTALRMIKSLPWLHLPFKSGAEVLHRPVVACKSTVVSARSRFPPALRVSMALFQEMIPWSWTSRCWRPRAPLSTCRCNPQAPSPSTW